MDNFYVHLQSDSSQKHFPNNTITNFKTWLHSPINLEADQYEVALVDLSYYENHKIVRKNDLLYKYTILLGADEAHPENVVQVAYEEYEVRATADIQSYDRESLTKQLSNTIINFVLFLEYVRLHVKRTGNFKLVTIEFTEQIAAMLGFPQKLTRPVNTEIQSDFKVDLSISGSRVFVYCDIIENQSVGDTSAPLLRNFIREHHGKATSSKGTSLYIQYIDKTFTNPQYKALSKGSIQFITVYLLNEHAQPPAFDQGALSATLHFRRKRW
jgi:hypothetical protein